MATLLPEMWWDKIKDYDISAYDARIFAFVKTMRDSVADTERVAAEGRMTELEVESFRVFAAIAMNCCKWFMADGPEDEVRNDIKDLAGKL